MSYIAHQVPKHSIVRKNRGNVKHFKLIVVVSIQRRFVFLL
jgi:hypothetical protein